MSDTTADVIELVLQNPGAIGHWAEGKSEVQNRRNCQPAVPMCVLQLAREAAQAIASQVACQK